jgi:hypothetical protein
MGAAVIDRGREVLNGSETERTMTDEVDLIGTPPLAALGDALPASTLKELVRRRRARHGDAIFEHPHLEPAQVRLAAPVGISNQRANRDPRLTAFLSARSISLRSKRKMAISTLSLALSIPFTRDVTPSPGCTRSFTDRFFGLATRLAVGSMAELPTANERHQFHPPCCHSCSSRSSQGRFGS